MAVAVAVAVSVTVEVTERPVCARDHNHGHFPTVTPVVTLLALLADLVFLSKGSHADAPVGVAVGLLTSPVALDTCTPVTTGAFSPRYMYCIVAECTSELARSSLSSMTLIIWAMRGAVHAAHVSCSMAFVTTTSPSDDDDDGDDVDDDDDDDDDDSGIQEPKPQRARRHLIGHNDSVERQWWLWSWSSSR